MSRRPVLILALLLALPLYAHFHRGSWADRAQMRRATEAGYVIPSKFSRVLAFGYKGLLSDYLFLKTATFMGERILLQQELTDEDWRYFASSIDVLTDLDPFFFDPYLLAEGFLAWDAGRIQEANRLLEKGHMYRSWDWRLPYFIGFNHFYFLQDNKRGSDYIMAAARLPGSPDFLPNLAARLAYYGGKSKTAIHFLREMMAETKDANLLPGMKKRLIALERAALIEEALEKFRVKEGIEPTSLNDLITHGYLEALPEDPYGGRWGVLKSGRVFSTSRFAEVPPKDEGRPSEGAPN